MPMNISLHSDSREKLLKGINKVADCVEVTLGAAGRNVAIFDGFKHHVTKDGVTVARCVSLADLEEETGCRIVRDAATRTNEAAGDGTTTAVVLTRSIAKLGIKAVAETFEPAQIKAGIDEAVNYVTKYLETNTVKINLENKSELTEIATISANGDREIGNVISDALITVGENGIVTVEDGHQTETVLDVVKGLAFDQGYLGYHFITNATKGIAEHEDCYVMIFRGKLYDTAVIEQLHPQLKGKPVLIIADDYSSDFLAVLALNATRGAMKVIPIKSPLVVPEEKRAVLEDIAIFTNARIIDETVQKHLNKLCISDLGIARKVITTKSTTTIVEGKYNPAKLETRLELLRNTEGEFAAFRLAKLTGGVAVIRVGGITMSEIKEKRDRVDDAVNSARAALKGGTIAGGGTALYHASEYVKASLSKDSIEKINDNGHSRGIAILLQAIQEPMRKIISNAGVAPDKVIAEMPIEDLVKVKYGYDVTTKQVVDMREAGIIDPVNVTIAALKNAASAAGLIITTDALISLDMPKDKDGKPINPFGMPR
jgi:chaperonin GroEL